MSAIDGKILFTKSDCYKSARKLFAVILDVSTAINLKEDDDNGNSETW